MAEGENINTAQGEYSPADAPNPDSPALQNAEPIQWTASEFIAHEKSAGWYGALAIVAALGAGLVYLVTKDGISAIVVLVSALFLGMYAGRQPRQLEYRLDAHGVGIDTKYFHFGEFRSFTIADEGAFSSIVFMPLKRFATTTTIYFAPDDEEKIITMISAHLPLEEHKPDLVDNLMRRIRF